MYRLHRFGVINIFNYEVLDKYVLIFLGDILDRGTYGVDILYFMTKFINNQKNKNKFFLNRGNHEEKETYDGDFLKEANKKFNDVAKTNLYR
jgi:hypothetical protein